jgi:integrase
MLAPQVLEVLRAHRARQAAERLAWGVDYTDSGLVITTEDGRPLHPETLSGLFVRQAKRAELPPIRLHDLRHSVASILLAQGVHPKVVREQLATRPSRSRSIPTATSSHRFSRRPLAS